MIEIALTLLYKFADLAKWVGVLTAFVVAAASGLFFLASGLANGSDDPVERSHAIQTRIVSFLIGGGALLFLAFWLSGCADVRTLYHACRDGSCR